MQTRSREPQKKSSTTTQCGCWSCRSLSPSAKNHHTMATRAKVVPSLGRRKKYAIDALQEYNEDTQSYLVSWTGYAEPSWEPRSVLIKDVPEMVLEYDRTFAKRPIALKDTRSTHPLVLMECTGHRLIATMVTTLEAYGATPEQRVDFLKALFPDSPAYAKKIPEVKQHHRGWFQAYLMRCIRSENRAHASFPEEASEASRGKKRNRLTSYDMSMEDAWKYLERWSAWCQAEWKITPAVEVLESLAKRYRKTKDV